MAKNRYAFGINSISRNSGISRQGNTEDDLGPTVNGAKVNACWHMQTGDAGMSP
jgi:hypothetical protein